MESNFSEHTIDRSPEEVSASNQEPDQNTSFLEQITQLQAQVSQQKDIALRALADLDNYRKRALREKEDTRKFANAALIEGLLPIIDNLQLGLDSVKDNPQIASLAQGFQLVLEQLNNLLKDFGLTVINPEGQCFDPNTQECVSHIPHNEIPDNDIVQVIRKGYALHEKLLRPATVIVSQGPSNISNTSQA